MEGHLNRLREIDQQVKQDAKVSQDVTLHTTEDKIEEQLEINDDDYIPASETLYATREDVQNMFKVALNIREETKLERLIDGSVERTAVSIQGNPQ